ncbi:variable surface protein [Plasmodium gonderi]|uniref:Variable surface protein n=1 Tax=Plasmodium gonderi TaxID=77519 RepID=A0A1Y1JT25_PLAGO|nr:variable surface protein [Plasmodium gonderi]GAW84588.1 variable surface protein [Plasmodium gonderi]
MLCNISTKIYTDYEFVGSFPKCEEIMKKYSGHNEPFVQCTEAHTSNAIFKYYNFLGKKCDTALSYVNHMNSPLFTQYLKESACFFFYYWIYNHIFDKQYSDDIKKFYDLLSKSLGIDITINCDAYNENINKSVLEVITNTYNKHKSLDIIKLNCESNKDEEFCEKISDIVNKYNGFKKIQVDETKITYPYQINIKFTIIITLFVISPYGSYMVRQLKRIRNKLNNVDGQWNIMNQREISQNISSDMMFNVLYNCD